MQEGRGFAQDQARALQWYERAAKTGSAEAMYNLGFMNEQGRGVPQDYSKAVEWYRKAADKNESAAQYSLGLMYEQGTGVARNLTEANRWYRLAAQNGDPDAKAVLRAQGKTLKTQPQNGARAPKAVPKRKQNQKSAPVPAPPAM